MWLRTDEGREWEGREWEGREWEGREWEGPASSGFSDKILEISCDCMHMCGYASV